MANWDRVNRTASLIQIAQLVGPMIPGSIGTALAIWQGNQPVVVFLVALIGLTLGVWAVNGILAIMKAIRHPVELNQATTVSTPQSSNDRGRLLSSLSAIQSEGVWLQTEIDNGNITSDYQWAVCDGVVVAWFRSIKRTLEAWDENDKSRLFGFEGLPAFPTSAGSQEDRIRTMREQIKRISGRIDALIRDLKKTLDEGPKK